MSKVKLLEQETKPQGWVLTKKGLQVARRTATNAKTMDGTILRMLVKSPGTPVTQGDLPDDLWRRLLEGMARLEEDGLVEKTDSGVDIDKPKVVIENTARPATLKLGGESKPTVFGLTKVVYGDKKGERLARRHHKGWKRVKY